MRMVEELDGGLGSKAQLSYEGGKSDIEKSWQRWAKSTKGMTTGFSKVSWPRSELVLQFMYIFSTSWLVVQKAEVQSRIIMIMIITI